MMSIPMMLLAVAVMAIVTYIPRVVPLVLFSKKIESRYLKSFLHYIPFAVLGAMIFPGILYSVPDMRAALAGTAVAVILAFLNRGMMLVAISAIATVYVCGLVL